MPFSYVDYSGTGSLLEFAVPFPYLSRSHVYVRAGLALVEFSWLSAGVVQLTTPPGDGTKVRVYRVTPSNSPLVSFQDGSTLTTSDLEIATLQSIYLAQEADDHAGEAYDWATDSHNRITALGTRVDALDVRVTATEGDVDRAEGNIADLNLKVNALITGQTSDRIVVSTYAVLSAIVTRPDGSPIILNAGATVLDGDGGYHSDPITGLWVLNAGIYAWAGTAWKRIGDVAASVLSVNPLSGMTKLLATTARLNVACLLDSLTEGAVGSNYVTYLRGALRAHKGYGGWGYMPFRNGESGVNFFKTGGLVYLSAVTDSTKVAPGIYSLNGRGLYCAAGTGTDYFTWRPSTNAWDTAKMYYLKKPGGGTFNWRFAGAASATKVLIDTNDAAGPSIGVLTIPANTDLSDSSLEFADVTGNVTFFGIEYLYGSTGANVSNLGIGGTRLEQWMALDQTFRRAWLTALGLNLVIFNGGMNDRLTRTPAQFEANLVTLLDDFAVASPSTTIILVRPNAPSDDATSYLPAYEAILKAQATARGLAFLNDRVTLGGTYAAAVAAGLMGDGIHPNDTGNRLRAQSYLKALGLPESYQNITIPTFGSVSSSVPSPLSGTLKATLTAQGADIAKGTPFTIYSLGLRNGYAQAVFRVRVSIQRSSSRAVTVRDAYFTCTSATINNRVDQYSAVTSSLIMKTLGADGYDQDITFSLAIVGGRAVLTGTITGSNAAVTGAGVSISGDWVCTAMPASSTGPIVYES